MTKRVARLTVITLGVADVACSIAFYERLGFERKFKASGEEVAFFDTGGSVLALYPWAKLAGEAGLSGGRSAQEFLGATLAWNCNSEAEVNEVLAFAQSGGARLLRAAEATHYGGYAGYFADPDGHVWEVVVAPGIVVGADGRLSLPD